MGNDDFGEVDRWFHFISPLNLIASFALLRYFIIIADAETNSA